MEKTKILKSLIIISLLISLLAIGTMAYLSDTEKSKENIFEVGTLDLKTNDKDGVSEAWTAKNWLPGDKVSGKISLRNAGTIDAESLLLSVSVTIEEGENPENEGE